MLSLLRTSGTVLGRRAFTTAQAAQAASFARISVLGRLGADPELSTTPNGLELIRYALAVSAGKDKPVQWYKVVDFAPHPTHKEYMMGITKGALVFVEGDANLRVIETEDGKKMTVFGVTQRKIEVILRKQIRQEGEEEENQ